MLFLIKISYNMLMEENKQTAPIQDLPPNNLNQEQDEEQPILPDTIYFSWTAPEFVENHKSKDWYVILIAVVLFISVAVFFIVKSIFPVVMIILISIIFGIIAARKPKNIYYELNNLGVLVGRRGIRYDEFKSFSVIDELTLGSIVFNPFKRFSLPLTIYFELDNKDKIIDIIKDYLPIEEAANDPMDQLMRRLRF